jgi:myo-inositol-1-phosphate synthase
MATDTRKTAADRGIGGSVSIIWACLFKSPPVSYTDAEAAGQMERFAGDLSK